MIPNLLREFRVHNLSIRDYIMTTLHSRNSPLIQLPNYGNKVLTQTIFSFKSGEKEREYERTVHYYRVVSVEDIEPEVSEILVFGLFTDNKDLMRLTL